MATLSKYLKDADISLRGFALKNEMSPSFLSELMSDDVGRRKSPSLDMALRIQSATDGQVSLSEWPKLAEIAKAFGDNTSVNSSPRVQPTASDKTQAAQ